MAQNDQRERLGRELAAVVSSYASWPAIEVSEAGTCQLRSRRGKEQSLNRHYAVSGPSMLDISRSYHSREVGGQTALYAMMDIIEYGQYEDSDCIMGLSTLRAQVKVTHVEYCRKGLALSREPQRYVRIKGHVHWTSDLKPTPLFCSNADCRAAKGEPNHGMYSCAMTAAPAVTAVGDRLELLYDSSTGTGRILAVAHLGSKRGVELYSFVPEKFILAGGFANVTLDIICARAN